MNYEQTVIRISYFITIENTVLALIKGVEGFSGNSYGLRDAINSTADILASLLVLVGLKYAK